MNNAQIGSSKSKRRYVINLYSWDQADTQRPVFQGGRLEILIGQRGNWVILRAIACSCLEHENCLNDSAHRNRNEGMQRGQKQNHVWEFRCLSEHCETYMLYVCACVFDDFSGAVIRMCEYNGNRDKCILFHFSRRGRSKTETIW